MTDAEKMMLTDAIEYAIKMRIQRNRLIIALISESVIVVVLAIIGGLLCG